MREVDVSQITAAVCDMCIESTHTLSEDMEAAFTKAVEEEGSPLAWPWFFSVWGRRSI